MELEILLKLLKEFGIMAVLGWFMIRLETIIKDNTKALIDLKFEIAKKK